MAANYPPDGWRHGLCLDCLRPVDGPFLLYCNACMEAMWNIEPAVAEQFTRDIEENTDKLVEK